MARKVTMNKSNLNIFLILLAVVAVLVGGYYVFNLGGGTTTKQIELSDRAQEFNISGDQANQYESVTFNPYYLHPGEAQELIVEVGNIEQIKSLQAKVEDDNNSKQLTFEKVEVADR